MKLSMFKGLEIMTMEMIIKTMKSILQTKGLEMIMKEILRVKIPCQTQDQS